MNQFACLRQEQFIRIYAAMERASLALLSTTKSILMEPMHSHIHHTYHFKNLLHLIAPLSYCEFREKGEKVSQLNV